MDIFSQFFSEKRDAADLRRRKEREWSVLLLLSIVVLLLLSDLFDSHHCRRHHEIVMARAPTQKWTKEEDARLMELVKQASFLRRASSSSVHRRAGVLAMAMP